MSCQCYQIGGPFIAEDPDCPAHGVDGYESVAEHLADRIDTLLKENEQLKAKLAERSWAGSVDRQGGSFDDSDFPVWR